MLNQTMPLYETGNETLRIADFLAALRSLGVRRGDALLVHSDVGVFGKLASPDRQALLGALVGALQDAVGAEGTIVMPTFTYSFCKSETFSMDQTPSTVGALTEFFRSLPDVRRTLHPIFSFALWGALRDRWLKVGKDSFDEDSLFARLREQHARIIFFGAPFQSCTFVHYIEQQAGVPYRYPKTFSGRIRTSAGEYEDSCTYFVRDLNQDLLPDFHRLEERLIQTGALQRVALGHGVMAIVGADAMHETGLALLQEDIYSLTDKKPAV